MARGRKRKAVSKQEEKQVEEVEDQKQEEEEEMLDEEKQMEAEDEEQDVEDDKEKQDDKDDEETQGDEDDEETQDDEEKQDDEDDEETQDDEEKQDDEDDEEKQDDEDDEETQDDEDNEEKQDEEDDEEKQDDEEGDQDEGENQEDEPEPKKTGRKRKRAGISKPEPKKAGTPGRYPKRTRISKSESENAEWKAKRTRTSTPEPEPEYFEDKRKLEDLWREVFPFSMKWDRLDSVYEHNWSFKNLEDAFEEEGALHGRRVYLFGCREPQVVPSKNKKRLTHIPVMVAVESPLPPSDKIAIVSVEKETQEIVPMKHMKMNWVPYISPVNRESQVERLKSDIYILWCNQRRTALKKDQMEKLQHCLPYFYNPLQEDESTVVESVFPIEPKPVVRAYDWDVDEVEDFTDKLIKEEELPADQKGKFMKDLKAKVKAQKKANKEAKVARQKARDELSPEKKAVFENTRIFKFYPAATPDSPDIVKKDLYINQYYGKAHELL